MAKVAFGLFGIMTRLALFFLVAFSVLMLFFSLPLIGHFFAFLFGFMFSLLEGRWIKFLPTILPIFAGFFIWLFSSSFDYALLQVITLQFSMLGGIWWGNFRKEMKNTNFQELTESTACERE